MLSKFKKSIALATLAAMTVGAVNNDLEAVDYYTNVGGYGYEASVATPSMTPYIILGTAVFVAIIAIAVRHHHHHSSHCHN